MMFYIDIMNDSGQILFFQGRRLGSYLERCTYEYKEKSEDDKCTLEFNLTKRTMGIIDLRYLHIDASLQIRWGFYNGSRSNIRKISVRDFETIYDKNGVRHVLKCSDRVSYLKNSKESNLEQISSFNNFLDKIAKGRYKVVKPEWDFILDLGQREPFQGADGDYNQSSAAVDNTATARLLATKYTITAPAGKSDWRQLQEYVEAAPEPCEIVGRDDTIHIKKENQFDRPRQATVRFDFDLNDDVLEFKPNSNHKSNDLDQDEMLHVDPETKEVSVFKRAANQDDKENKDEAGIDDSDQEEKKIKYLNQGFAEPEGLLTAAIKAMTGQKSYSPPADTVDQATPSEEYGVPSELDGEEFLNYISSEVSEEFKNYAEEVFNHNNNAPLDEKVGIDEFFKVRKFNAKPIPSSILAQSPYIGEDIKNFVMNELAKKEYQKRKANIKLRADNYCHLESGNLIAIYGGAASQCGDYYMKEVTFKLDYKTGAKVTIQGIQKPPNKTALTQEFHKRYGEQDFEKEEAEWFDTIKPYITEKELLDVVTKSQGREIWQENQDFDPDVTDVSPEDL